MSATICPECGEELEIGSYPFCSAPGGHASVYAKDALSFDPAVVWQSVSNPGQYSFPGSSSEPCPAGYRPVVLDTLSKAERFTREFNAQERERLSGERAMEKAYWDDRIKQSRSDRRARLGHNPQALALMEAIARYRDAKRERKYGQKIEPNFHLQPLEFDAGNRQGYSSRETGWKDRKA
ncbi:MAG TPA: hypothetical protein VEL77_15310 [Rugosimonospora sp.]|nr:hypothetical protein [Rugosimonospora sp.]